jgi:hypothetical protein
LLSYKLLLIYRIEKELVESFGKPYGKQLEPFRNKEHIRILFIQCYNDAKCVLCHQPFDNEQKRKDYRLLKFCQCKLESEATQAEKNFKEKINKFLLL